ncbi:MAG: Sb-PDE family phosphodiesterase [Bacteroidota bacterium]
MNAIRKIQLVVLLSLFTLTLYAQPQFRNKINFPDILGYKSLKCDFHTHTVFSDGNVWPTYRVEEAWRDGLDVIALTDHIEYQPHKDYIPSNHNAPVQIAKNFANELGITLIQGAEITRNMPPGHLNAIFVKDGNALVKDDWKEVVLEAKRQGALLFWNHPAWVAQQPDGIAKWYAEHDWLLETGILFGLEVYNANVYSPETHQWCIDKKLAVLGNSDVHDPLHFEWEAENVAHRPITLVFAKDRSQESVREALLDRRTAIWYDHKLIGDEKYLKEIFSMSISIDKDKISAIGRESRPLLITNNSDVDYELKLVSGNSKIQFPKEMKLMANRTLKVSVRAAKEDQAVKEIITAVYEVKNLITAPGKTLQISYGFDFDIQPKK